jgi:hypothetical protein
LVSRIVDKSALGEANEIIQISLASLGYYGGGEGFNLECHGVHLHEQVQQRHGPFYEATKPLFVEDEE